MMTAGDALKLGILNEVVAGDVLMDRVYEMANQIADNSASAIAMAKAAMTGGASMDLDIGKISSWDIWPPALELRISRRDLLPLKKNVLQNSAETGLRQSDWIQAGSFCSLKKKERMIHMAYEGRGLYLEEFEIGKLYETVGRTITEADVANFAGLSGDFNPLHMDDEFAKTICSASVLLTEHWD